MSQTVLPRQGRILPTMVDALLELVLGRDRTGARLRQAIIAASLGAYWFFLALLADFPQVLPDSYLATLPFPADLLLDLFTSLFSARVLLHLIPVLAALWVAYRVGALYLTDLFELESFSIASSYLRAALFGMGYPGLSISQGQREGLDRNSPILRIGGPGYLNTHLGFAAIFERLDSRPRVYGPQAPRFLGGFERLRDVVDLRDQIRQVDEVRAITKDGIEVFARDAQMVFRVYSGERPRNLNDPYPYTDAALRRIVYGRAVSGAGPAQWTHSLAGLVSSEIRKFVETRSLEDFLALQPEPISKGSGNGDEGDAPDDGAMEFHIRRRQLTESFHTKESRERLKEAGLELLWVGVGTWEIRDKTKVPGGSGGVEKTLINAWRDLQRARRFRSSTYLERQATKREREFIGRSLRELLDTWEDGGFRERYRCWAMLKYLESFLEEMRFELAEEPEAGIALEFQASLAHLNSLTKARELGGD